MLIIEGEGCCERYDGNGHGVGLTNGYSVGLTNSGWRSAHELVY